PVWVLSEIIERVSNHPTVDGWHDPETLGGGQECTWTDQFPLLALQTQQNFPVPIIERGNDRADGLVTEQELPLLEGGVESGCPIHFLTPVHDFLGAELMHHDPVSAAFFGDIAGVICLIEHLFE